jgi:hypothetical protein
MFTRVHGTAAHRKCANNRSSRCIRQRDFPRAAMTGPACQNIDALRAASRLSTDPRIQPGPPDATTKPQASSRILFSSGTGLPEAALEPVQRFLGDLGADRRSSCAVRVGPVASDQAAVPAQDGAGGDQSADSQLCRQEPGQCGEDCAVGPVEAGPRIGPSQHGDLVSQHESSAFLQAGDRLSRISQPQSRTKMR